MRRNTFALSFRRYNSVCTKCVCTLPEYVLAAILCEQPCIHASPYSARGHFRSAAAAVATVAASSRILQSVYLTGTEKMWPRARGLPHILHVVGGLRERAIVTGVNYRVSSRSGVRQCRRPWGVLEALDITRNSTVSALRSSISTILFAYPCPVSS